MTSLTSTVSNHAAAEQSGWTEIVDIYLPSAITTPWGSLATIRLTMWPVDLTFFAPGFDPEPAGTRNTAATYKPWPLQRSTVSNSGTEVNDTFTLSGSNVSGEFAGMLMDIDWRRARVVIRKVPTLTGVTLTANDCVTLFSGYVRSARIDLQTVALSLTSDISGFGNQYPESTFHPSCRFQFGDDYCAGKKWTTANFKGAVTCGSGSTKSIVVPSGLSEDAGSAASYGTDLIDPLSTGAITTSSQLTLREGYQVRHSSTAGSYWAADFSGANIADWGVLTQGYWIINTAQAGLANPLLEPYITFDFGSAKTPRVWRLKGPNGLGRESLPRLLLLFSSADASSWTHEGYFECPPIENQLFDWNVPLASTKRYWRICMRTRWATGVLAPVFNRVYAYEDGRNFWRGATITFAANTTTAALRGVSRTIKASYASDLRVDRPLPAAPVSGDTFSLARGCTRSFNHCCEHRNWLNFGGWPEALGTELQLDANGQSQTETFGGVFDPDPDERYQ